MRVGYVLRKSHWYPCLGLLVTLFCVAYLQWIPQTIFPTGHVWPMCLQKMYPQTLLWLEPMSGGSPKGGANLLFGNFFPKAARKWRNLWRGARPSCPLRSATAYDQPWSYTTLQPFFLHPLTHREFYAGIPIKISCHFKELNSYYSFNKYVK